MALVMNYLPSKSNAASRVTLTELMIPAYANFGGKIHGGILLSLMDKAAYACASRHAGGYCVTVSVDTVNFRAPVEVGDLVSLMASINYVGKSSMVVGIRVVAENVAVGDSRHTNTSYFTMIAKGDDGKPTQVPGLILESTEDLRRYIEAIKRIELRGKYDEELERDRSNIQLKAELDMLQGRRVSFDPALLE
jgi:acyl-CoA hydrolase